MTFLTQLTSAALAAMTVLVSAPAFAGSIMVEDAYARAASPNARSGAAFMAITNMGDAEDRLVDVTSDVSARVELHTHIQDGDVMRMVHVEDGFALPAGETVMLERGGKHVMFMGLNRPLDQGATVEVTLTFEKAGDMTIAIPVDLERMPEDHGGLEHSSPTN